MSKSRTYELDRLAAMFKALSHPKRLRIFLKLAACCGPGSCGELTSQGMRRCVGELGGNLGLAASTVSHHLKALRHAGLMHMERRGQRIECWISRETLELLAAFFGPTRGGADVRRASHAAGR